MWHSMFKTVTVLVRLLLAIVAVSQLNYE